MKLHSNVLAAASIVLQFAMATLPTPALGHKVLHQSNDDDNTNRIVPIKRDHLEIHTQLTSRLLDLDTSTLCSNACDADRLQQLRAPFLDVEIVEEEEEDNQGIFSRLFGRFTGLFQFFHRRRSDADDRREYLIPTEPIVSLLSKSNTKIMSLVDLLRLEGHKNESPSPDFVSKLYDLSAENMESVVAMLDLIVADVQQSHTINIQTLGCHMTDLSNLLHGITIPNIEFIAQSMYTNSDNSELQNRFHDYTEYATTTQSSLTFASENRNPGVCSVHDASSNTATTSVARRFSDIDLGSTTSRQSLDFQGNLILLPLYILFFPLSIVISIVGIILTIILIPILLLFAVTFVPANDDNAELILIIVGVALLYAISAPLSTIFVIIATIFDIVRVLLSPLFPTESPFITTEMTLQPMETIKMMTSSSTTPPQSIKDVSVEDIVQNIRSHLLALLESPLDQIKAFIFQNESTFRGIDENDQYDIECELSKFQCQNMALMDVLPF